MTNAIKVNMNNKTMTIPSAFAKKAEIFGTPEFRQLMEAKKELREYTGEEFKVVIAKKAKKSVSLDEPKEKKIRPTYVQMNEFIKSLNDKEAMDEFKRQREMTRFGTTKYNGTLAWFLNTFANNENYKEAFRSFEEMVAAKVDEAVESEAENTTTFPQAENF